MIDVPVKRFIKVLNYLNSTIQVLPMVVYPTDLTMQCPTQVLPVEMIYMSSHNVARARMMLVVVEVFGVSGIECAYPHPHRGTLGLFLFFFTGAFIFNSALSF